MVKLFNQMWADDAGYIISTEMLLIFVILVLGLIAGMANLRMAIVNELTESAQAILQLNQSFTISGLTGCSGSSGASGATDTPGTTTLVGTSTAPPIGSTLCP
jgi:hypothetical protein